MLQPMPVSCCFFRERASKAALFGVDPALGGVLVAQFRSQFSMVRPDGTLWVLLAVRTAVCDRAYRHAA